MIDLNEIAEKNYLNAIARGYRAENAFRDLKAAAGEIVEAAMAFDDWCNNADEFDCISEEYERRFQLEVADVIMCMLLLSHAMKWDMENILQQCLIKNEKRIKGGE